MPPVKNGWYLVEIACSVGIHDLKWKELAAWMQATGSRLSPWEAEAVKLIGAAYSGGITEFSGKNDPAPYSTKKTQEDSIRSAIRKRR